MALVNSGELLSTARSKGYCVGAFNVVDYLSLQAVIQTAAELKAPVIVQTSPSVVRQYGAAALAGMANGLVDRYPAQVGLHLDHGTDLLMIQECLQSGYTSVMIDASHEAFDINVARTRQVVQAAHARGVAVEAEIGILAGTEDDLVIQQDQAIYTTPEEAIAFQNQSGCDFLAVAIGTAHGFYKVAPRLDIATLRMLRDHTSFPLVVHGGTGLSTETLRELVLAGASKLNISTQLKKTYQDALQGYLNQHPDEYNPLKLFSYTLQELAVMVTGYLQVFGAVNQAEA